MKNKKILSIFSTVLTLILLLSSIPLSPFVTFATEEAKASEAVKVSLFEGLKEDPAMRDRFTKHYYDKNGTYYAVVYPEQIHYVEDGQWADVDNTLKYDLKTASYVNENPKFSFGFAANSESSNLVTISDGSYTLSWSVRMNSTADDRIKLSENELQSFEVSINRSASAVISAAVSNKKATPEDLTSEIKAVSGIRYSGVLNNEVDLRYTAYHGKIEEDVILNEKGTFESYTMTVNTDGLTATVADDSSVVFTNAEGKTVFTIAAPWMCDANGELSDDITVSITQIRNTAYITYTPSAEWLSDDNRAYPVLIDPSVTSRYYTNNYQDTYVASGDSTSYASQRYMFVGNKSSRNIKALVKIINMPEILGSANVGEAKFNFWLTDTSNPTLKISHANSAWDASTVTYANCPTGSQLAISGRDGMDQSDVEIDPYEEEEYVSYSRYSYNIIDWVNGSYTNNGFIIEYNTLTTGQNVRIWSSEHTEAKFRPTITFKYEFEQNECLESGAIYSFVSAKTEKCLTVENGIDANGTNLILQDDSMSPSQSFRLEYNDVNDSFKFRAVCSNDGTGKVVNISYDSTVDPTTGYTASYVQLWDYTPSLPQNQEWLIIPVSNDRYKIVSAYDPRLALTLHGSSDVVVTTDTGSIGQLWYIESGWVRMTENSINVKKHNNVGEANVGTNTTKLFYPVTLFGDSPSWSVDSNSVASITYEGVVNAITAGSVDLSLEIIDDYGHGRFYTIHFYSKLPNGVYTLQCQYSEGYLESPYGNVQNGTQYILWDETTNNNSRFKVVYLGEGKYVLRSMVASNRAVAMDSQNRVVSQKIADYDTLAGVPTNAQWIITAGSYEYELKNVATGLYLEGENGDTGYESLVTGDTQADNNYQGWEFNQVTGLYKGISIINAIDALAVGEEYDLIASYYSSVVGENSYDGEYRWSIEGTGGATISLGRIITTSVGTVTVTVRDTGNNWTASCVVVITNLLIYQSPRSYREEEGGQLARDLECGDLSESQLRDLAWINWLDFDGYTPQMHLNQWSNMAAWGLSQDELEDVALDMIDHFMEGSGDDYSNSALTEAVIEHDETQRYITLVENKIKESLESNNSDITALNCVGVASDENPLGITWEDHPVFDEYYIDDIIHSDLFNGIMFCIHDLWGLKMEVTSFTNNGTTYTGTVHYTFYDHFGLDENDVESYGFASGFKSWYILQHFDEYNEAYKPFLTLIEFDVTFSGSI